MIRAAAKHLSEALKQSYPKVSFTEISKDASSVLIRFDNVSNDTAQDIKERAINYFQTGYPDLTFVVDQMLANQDFVSDQNRLLAANRLRQLQQISLALPIWNDQEIEKPVCELDGVRPTSRKAFRDKKISFSVHNRLTFGRSQRKQFYQNELGDDAFDDSLEFTDDLQSLAASDCWGNLNDKIAVIYLDGNNFGSIQSNYATTADKKSAFDSEVASKHRAYLQKLLNTATARQNKDRFWTNDNKLRLEVLLWGGDEILIVVPAWCGFDVLQLFYQYIEGWEYQEEAMTYSGGLVFSQANTPIYRLTALAKKLAESIKSAQQNGDRGNYFDYVVLESIDYPSQSITGLRNQQYHHAAPQRQFLEPLPDDDLRTLQHMIQVSDFPKSKLVELARTYVAQGEEAAMLVKNRVQHIITAEHMARVESYVKALFRQPQTFWNWVHLAELWDYLLLAKGDTQ